MGVSVIIPTCRRINFIPTAISSVLKQTLPVDEIIVVNDHHDDYDALKRICYELSDKIYVVQNERAKGGCGARNTGILAAKEEYISFLDDDDYFLPNKLEAQIKEMICSEINISFCGHYLTDEFLKPKKCNYANNTIYGYEQLLTGDCPASTSLVVMKRVVAIEAGMFDEGMSSLQDIEFWVRAIKYSKFLAVNAPLVLVRDHFGDRVSMDIDKRIAAIDGFGLKLSSMGVDVNMIDEFKKIVEFALYRVNAKRLLRSNSDLALNYAIKALILSRNKFKPLLFAAAIYVAPKITDFILRFIDDRTASGLKKLSFYE